MTGSQQPLTAVTRGEEAQVARVLETGVARRLIDRHGVPLVTAHGTATTDVDRRLGRGETHVVSDFTDSTPRINPHTTLRRQITSTWAHLDVAAREHWIRAAGADVPSEGLAWSDVSGESKSKIIMLYLRTHTPTQAVVPFQGPPIKETAATAARRMFNHRDPLDSGTLPLERGRSEGVVVSDAIRDGVRSDRAVQSPKRAQH